MTKVIITDDVIVLDGHCSTITCAMVTSLTVSVAREIMYSLELPSHCEVSKGGAIFYRAGLPYDGQVLLRMYIRSLRQLATDYPNDIRILSDEASLEYLKQINL